MQDMTTTRMLLTSAVLATVAALFAGGANAMLMDVEGGSGSGAVSAPSVERGTIQPSLGLTGDSALTRVSAPEPEGLTGDSALTRVDRPVIGSGQATSSGSDTDWTWIGLGTGMAALLAAALTGFYFSARHRGRVALP
jgi:hypothetical protein